MDPKILPRLVIRRPNLWNLPPLEIPGGFSLRHFQPGDEQTWNKIIRETFQTPDRTFDEYIKNNPEFRPERVLFFIHERQAVATACAWKLPFFGPDTGCLHMVGVLPAFQGKGLGYQISLAVLYQLVAGHLKDAVVLTYDFRLTAIKIYLKLGFEPFLIHENQRDRWRNILHALSLNERFEPFLKGPVVRIEGL